MRRKVSMLLALAPALVSTSAIAENAPAGAAAPAPSASANAAVSEPNVSTSAAAPAVSVAPSATAPAPSAPAAPAPSAPISAAAPAPTVAPPPAATPTPVVSKWTTTFYGFVDFDAIHDSTQSFTESAGNNPIARPSTYAGKHARTTFAARNSRIGFKMVAPETHQIRGSAVVEMDFFGNQPNPSTEAAFFSNPTFRLRHAVLKLESPVIDLWVGQTWSLFSWQGAFHPNTVQIQGVPGELFSRSAQVRLTKSLKIGSSVFDLAVAAARPVQRNSATPDGHAGLRFTYNGWKGVRTAGATATQTDGFSLGVSGIVRRFRLPEFSSAPSAERTATGRGVSIDALVPIVPATAEDRAYGLTFTGSFATGRGISDMYTGLTAGVTFPSLPNPNAVTPAPVYTSDVDPGVVTYDAQGKLHTLDIRSFIVGLQYYLPPSGNLWISANYSQTNSNNALRYADTAARAKIFDKSRFWDVNVFLEATTAMRFGAEYANFHQTYGDGVAAKNHRVQFSGYYLF